YELIDKIATNYKANDGILWAISFKENPKLLGTIGFWRITKEHYRAEIGYILDPEHWGKGIMHEAMKAVLNYGFTHMNLHSVEAVVNPDNDASISVLERNKFKREAYYRENYYYQGKFLDSGVYSLIISEWDN
ncbi:MAG TPA: GNAT family protein, partial [Saprospiraceae bacterium]|nr:GNAT family protein [Saprospiraceae bacterium]